MAQHAVLSNAELDRALTRIAHEIIESLPSQPDVRLILAGIQTRGVPLARRLANLIESFAAITPMVASLDVTPFRDDTPLDGHADQSEFPDAGVTGSTVVIVDDVLHTGRTVRAALDALVRFGRPSAVRLAVMVDRGHREFPIRPDFVGKNLPSSDSERIQVRLIETDGYDAVELGAVS